MNDKEIKNAFNDVAPLESKTQETPKPDYFLKGEKLEVGAGETSLRMDQRGLWIGATEPVKAPFSISPSGDVVMTDAAIFFQDSASGRYTGRLGNPDRIPPA